MCLPTGALTPIKHLQQITHLEVPILHPQDIRAVAQLHQLHTLVLKMQRLPFATALSEPEAYEALQQLRCLTSLTITTQNYQHASSAAAGSANMAASLSDGGSSNGSCDREQASGGLIRSR